MNQIFITLPIKPMSLNNAKIPIKMGKFMRLADSPACRKYKAALKIEFMKHRSEIMRFGIGYDKTKHAIEAVWRLYIPQKEYFTLKGTISEKCIDATNSIKLMEDGLVEFLKIDDSQIIETIVRKIPTDNSTWFVSLELSQVMKPLVTLLNTEK